MYSKQDIERILEGRIITGEYKIGDTLESERALAEKFEVSKGMIHDVLLSLKEKGFIESRARSGNIVSDWEKKANMSILEALLETTKENTTKELARSFAEFRIFNEGKCAALAAQNRNEEDLKRIRDTIDRLDEVEDASEFALALSEFHHSIFIASANKLYAVLFGAFKPLIELWSQRMFPDWRSYDTKTLKYIARCIEERNAIAAECAMNAYTTECVTRIANLRYR